MTRWSVDAVLEAVCACHKQGHFCCTDAYAPARFFRAEEAKFLEARGVQSQALRAMVVKASERVRKLWGERLWIAKRCLESRAFRLCIESIRRVSGFNGSGFVAKEIALDLLDAPIFSDWRDGTWQRVCTDDDSFCPAGPGARRGLNRLARRPVKWQIGSASRNVFFEAEMKEIWKLQHNYWKGRKLTLADIQFNLCEFDKYQRHREGGRVRLRRHVRLH